MNQGTRICLLGAGGHSVVVGSTLEAAGHEIAAVLDDNEAMWGKPFLGRRIAGPVDRAGDIECDGFLISVGDNLERKKIAEKVGALRWVQVVHPAAWVHPSVHIMGGTVIFAGAMIQPEVKLGRHVIINTSATVDHHCSIGDFVHLAPGAHLAGHVTLEEGVMLGMGAVVRQTLTLHAWSVVGAGSSVVSDVSKAEVVGGVPARPLT